MVMGRVIVVALALVEAAVSTLMEQVWARRRRGKTIRNMEIRAQKSGEGRPSRWNAMKFRLSNANADRVGSDGA
jgi:hypothetical protein